MIKKTNQQSAFWQSKQQSLLKVYLEKELELNERIVFENNDSPSKNTSLALF